MPAQRLGNRPVSVSRYDVVALDSPGVIGFIQHVGLLNEETRDLSLNDIATLAHMKPPLAQRDAGCAVHATGSAKLDVTQVRQIGVFVDEQDSEYKANEIRAQRQYVIVPHVREPDAGCSCRRFSCAGFVIEAYRYAGIDLVCTDLASLPRVSLEMLSQAYPDISRLAKAREQYGLSGEGPWPVVMAGYVLNSLARTVDKIAEEPYLPRVEDAYFPPGFQAQSR